MADNAKIVQTADELELLLDELGEVESFDPPPEFRARARITDPEVYAAAARDPEGYWAGRARELHWDTPFSTVLDESKAPFVTWFADGTLNVSYNCLDRHVEAGLGERIAYHWRGEEGEERDITYAELHRDVQRLANGLKDLGVGQGDVVGIFLPMIPEVVVAMLACARIGAPHNVVFGGFAPDSVRERMEVSHAKALITVDGARRKGKTAAIKHEVDRVMSGLTELRSIVVVRHTGTDCAMQDGRDVFYDELLARSEPVCPAEPLPSEHPLFILYSSGSTAKPKGILHTTGGYLTGVAATHRDVFDLRPDSDVFWCTADVGWVTGHSYIVYGPLANGCTSVMFEGAPDYPAKDVWWEIIERYGVTIFYTAPTAIRVCMKWGVEYPNKHDSVVAAPAGVGRRTDQPEGLALVLRGGRAPAVSGGRHLVADRDRPDHDRPAAGADGDQARLGHPSAARHLGGAGGHRRQRDGRRDGAAGPHPTVAGNAAHPVRRRRALRLDVLRAVRPAHLRGR